MEITATSADVTEELCTITRTRAFGEAFACAIRVGETNECADRPAAGDAVALEPGQGECGSQGKRQTKLHEMISSAPMLEP